MSVWGQSCTMYILHIVFVYIIELCTEERKIGLNIFIDFKNKIIFKIFLKMVEPSSFSSCPCSAEPAWQILVCWDSWEDGVLPRVIQSRAMSEIIMILMVSPASTPQSALPRCPPQPSCWWGCCRPSPGRPPRSFYSWSTTFSPLLRPNIRAWNR